MKAEEIRDMALPTRYGSTQVEHRILREIAAQLAELNLNLQNISKTISAIRFGL